MMYGADMVIELFTDKLRKDLENDEGIKYEIYVCSLGVPTFGIGHMVKPTDPESKMEVGDKVSKERCESAFEEDIEITISDCKKIFNNWQTLPEDARLVTANMCFQLGLPRLRKFKKTIDACNRGEWLEMASEMKNSKWHKQTTARAERLIKRIQGLDQT